MLVVSLYPFARKYVTNRFISDLQSQTTRGAKNIEALLDEYKNIIRLIATDYPLIEYPTNGTRGGNGGHGLYLGKMKDIMRYYPDIASLSLVNKNGQVTVSTDEILIGLDKSLSPTLKPDSNFQIGHRETLYPIDTITFSHPINRPNGEEGRIVAEIRIDTINKILSSIGEELGWVTLSVVDKEGNGISRLLSRNSEDESAIKRCSKNNGTNSPFGKIYRYKNGGFNIVGTCSPIEGTNWSVKGELKEEGSLAIIRSLKLILILFSLFFVSISYLVSIYISDLVLDPIDNLKKEVERVGLSNMDFNIDTTHHEVAEIAELADSIKALITRAKDINRGIEEKIAARSRDLIDTLAGTEEEKNYLERNRTAMLNIMEDLEERQKRLVAEISNREKAEKRQADTANRLLYSNKQLEEFAYMASHDLQEPLRKVVAFSDRLREKYSHALDEKGLDYMARMNKAVGRMQQLIKDLLSYSRVSSSQETKEAVNLYKTIKEVAANLRSEERGDIIDIDLDEGAEVLSNNLHIYQLFQNLIDNGLKFRKQDEPPHIKIYGERAGQGFYQITVKDNGIGFDEKYKEKIFTIFQRLHGQGEYQGTGIGLSICKKIVDNCNGKIRAESTLGEGAAFILRLPIYNKNMR